MRVALDTNVLAYAEGINGAPMKRLALNLVQRLPQGNVVVPVQTLGELFAVLVRKGGRTASKARAAILNWSDAFSLVETTPAVLLGAADLAAAHQLTIWDAVIFSAAAEARCQLLLSEDLQDGFTWNGVAVANPFSPTRHALLDALIEPSGRRKT